jgi:hypothetical protein
MRHMHLDEVAQLLDVRTKVIFKAMKRTGLRLTVKRQKGKFVLADDDIAYLCQVLNKRRLRPLSDQDDDGTPGLPLEWWGDPAHTSEFVAERFRRERRLLVMIREAGLTRTSEAA